MPITVNTNFINQSDQYLLDAKNVKGTYVVVENYSALASLPSATTINGSLAYCQAPVTVSSVTYTAGFYQYDGSAWNKIDYVTSDKYHTTGTWNGLTYTATNQGGAGDLAFTIPTGSGGLVEDNDARLTNSREPLAHADSTTKYGAGTTANYGHVKLDNSALTASSTNTDGVAAGLGHKHSQYGTYSKPSGGIPDSDLASTFVKSVNNVTPDNSGDATIDSDDILVSNNVTSGYAGSSLSTVIDDLAGRFDNTGTVTSVQVQAGAGLTSSQDTAQTTALNTTIGIDSNYKLPTNAEFQDSSLYWATPTGYAGIASALSARWVSGNIVGFTEPYNGMKIMVKIPVAGVGTAGAMLAIDGGSDWNTYHPIAYNLNTVFTTHYPVNTSKIFVYNATQTMTGYWMSPLTTQPSDWATKYTSYYQTTGDVNDPKSTWTAVTGNSAPTFVANKYGKATSKTYTGVWQGESNYDSNTTMTYGTLAYYLRPYMTQALYRYKFVMFDADNRLVPLTTTDNSMTAYADYGTSTTYAKNVAVHRVSGGVGRWYKSLQASNKGHAPESNPTWWEEISDKIPTALAFRPDKIYWYTTTTTISAGGVIGGNVLMDIGYNQPYMAYCNFNKGILAYRLLYLCGTYNKTTGLFTLNDGGVAASDGYYTQVPTNTANLALSNYFISGKDYILVGGTYSSNNYLHLRDDHPMFHFDGTNLIPYDTYNDNRLEGLISETDTWRSIQVNDTELLGTGTSTGALNFKNGSNVEITGSGNDITIAASYTDTNQTIKGNGTVFGTDDAVDIKGSGIVSVTGNATNKEITISASHQNIKSLNTTADTAQSTAASEAVAGSGTITLHKISKTGTYNDLLGKPTLGTAAAKDFTTDVTEGSADLLTSGAVYTALNNLPAPMIYKGTLGTGGTITALPAAAASNEGYTYKVITNGTYASQAATVGDMFISNGSAWTLIPSGDEGGDTWRSVQVNGTELLGTAISTGAANFKNGSNVSITGSGNDITIAATDTNQTIKGNGTAFGSNDVVDIKGSGIVTVSGNATNKEITISASHQGIKSLDTTATTAQSTAASEAITGSGTVSLHKISKTGTYTDLISRPVLDTTATAAQSTSASETITGTVTLHKVSKTGSYNDLNNKPTIPSAPGTLDTTLTVAQSTSSSEALSGAIKLHKVSKTGSYNDLNDKPSIPGAPGTLNTTATTAQSTAASEALTGSITLHKVSKTGTYSDLIGTPTVDTAVSTSSANAVQNKAIPNYIASRGENLLTNGTCLLGNNYNFSGLTFDASDTYYAGGCFKWVGGRKTTNTDEFMPVDVTQVYEVSYYAKCSSTTSTLYDYFLMYDIDKNIISASHVMWITGSTTTLAQDLKPDDTKVYLTSISGFNQTLTQTYQRGLIFWNYVSSGGYAYPTETYSRNKFTDLWADASSFNTSENSISLKAAWPSSRGTIPAGTPVSQCNDGGTYTYMNSRAMGNTNWNKMTGIMSGVGKNNAGGKFREGTAFVKLGWLINQNAESNVTYKLSTLSVCKRIPDSTSQLTNDRFVRYDTASQGLSTTQKSNARTNIGAGTSSFSGSYNDLTNKPTIPTLPGDLVTGTGTSTKIPQWNGAHTLTDTGIAIDNAGVVTFPQTINTLQNATSGQLSSYVTGTCLRRYDVTNSGTTTKYADLYPYNVDQGWLGTANYPWKRIYTQYVISDINKSDTDTESNYLDSIAYWDNSGWLKKRSASSIATTIFNEKLTVEDMYTITPFIMHGSLTGQYLCSSSGLTVVGIRPLRGYSLPSSVSVVGGATSSYSAITGVITLSNVNSDISILAACPATTYSVTPTVSFNTSDGAGYVYVKKDGFPTSSSDYDYYADGWNGTHNFPASFAASKLYVWMGSDEGRNSVTIGSTTYYPTSDMSESDTPWMYALEIALTSDTSMSVWCDQNES